MRVAAIQHDIVWEDPAATFALVEPMIEQAVAEGAQLIALTEMFSTGFSMASERIAEPLDGPGATFLLEQAAHHGVHIVASVPTRHPDHERPINQATIAGPDGLVARYAKIHPFSFAGEDQHYSAGSPFCTVEIHGVRCTVFICYDLRFADEFWATAADTDLFVVVANWPAARRLHWQTLLRARAIENQTFVLAVNRVGTDGNGLEYAGDSTLIDPLGTTLAEAVAPSSGKAAPAVISGEVLASTVTEIRERFPFALDRR